MIDNRHSKCWIGFIAIAISASVIATGCGRPEVNFSLNTVYAKAKTYTGEPLTQAQLDNIADVVQAMFNTPDEPSVPQLASFDMAELLNIDQLALAAGPVGRDEDGIGHGLYREHCVHCHGINGDGAGPTAAFLNPYPRDYRRGTYKFKTSKGINEPPTHDDLKRILINGVPGTAMPSFKVLDDGQIDALVHYVKYLSLRGQVERKLIDLTVDELDEGELLLDLSNKDSSDPELQALFQGKLELIREEVTLLASTWVAAESIDIPEPPENWESPEAVKRGRELFFTSLTNCSKCHGNTALGDGQVDDYDVWTKDWIEGRTEDHKAIAEFMRLGALKPRNAIPRNLRQDVRRGGRRPVDLFCRIKNGIAGTPMPAAAATVTDEDVWALVAYVRQLPFESISQPEHLPDFQRDIP